MLVEEAAMIVVVEKVVVVVVVLIHGTSNESCSNGSGVCRGSDIE